MISEEVKNVAVSLKMMPMSMPLSMPLSMWVEVWKKQKKTLL